ncbi:hypothetical protein CTI12_AA427050 [Artemisia annua]|uniref:Uncharacterized protein n=1 Tax=Artemisia annua TaxID=35608 RepID=A0A2U1LMH6_ARTAN|nr:hypothetical protein CTI12_AA427050 [Artemisia annua]
MATSAFKSTTKRSPITTSDDSPPSSSSAKSHRRSRSLSRFSRPVMTSSADVDVVVPTPRRKFVNTVRGSGGGEFSEISLDDLAIEFFSSNDNNSYDEEDDGSGSVSRIGRISRPVSRARSVSRGPGGGGGERGRSVSRRNEDKVKVVTNEGVGEGGGLSRRGRSVSRRNDAKSSVNGNNSSSYNGNGGGNSRVVGNGDVRRRRSVSVARHQISDSESDIDLSLSSTTQPKSRSINNASSRVASFQRPTASSHRRITRSMSQAPPLRSHDGYSSQSSALTDDDLRDARYGRNEIEKTIRAVYAQKKMDHPTGDDTDSGIYEAMRKELRSAVNEIRIELEQTMERKPSALSVHDRLYSNKSDNTSRKNFTPKLKQPEPRGQDGYKIVREVLPEPKRNASAQRVSYPRKRSNDRNRVSKRLNEEAEKYFEDFISNIEDTDFSSFDGERSDTSSSLVGPTKQNGSPAGCNSVPVEMEGINLPWLKWDGNDGVPPVTQNTMPPPATPKSKLWDPSQDLKLIQEQVNGSSSGYGSWDPKITTANSTNARGSKFKETKVARFDMDKYLELEKTEELLFDSWRDRSMISYGGLLLCGLVTTPLTYHSHF